MNIATKQTEKSPIKAFHSIHVVCSLKIRAHWWSPRLVHACNEQNSSCSLISVKSHAPLLLLLLSNPGSEASHRDASIALILWFILVLRHVVPVAAKCQRHLPPLAEQSHRVLSRSEALILSQSVISVSSVAESRFG